MISLIVFGIFLIFVICVMIGALRESAKRSKAQEDKYFERLEQDFKDKHGA